MLKELKRIAMLAAEAWTDVPESSAMLGDEFKKSIGKSVVENSEAKEETIRVPQKSRELEQQQTFQIDDSGMEDYLGETSGSARIRGIRNTSAFVAESSLSSDLMVAVSMKAIVAQASADN
ncbi:MAG: hypothetical protein OXP75_13710 [Rhodospirillales bacterium]|nr:hypothetical protein [Rhodospirillales bacterium]